MNREIVRLVAKGFYVEAFSMYSQHHSASLSSHNFIFPPLFKACAKLNSVPQGQMLHTHLMKVGFSADVYAATALTDMYLKLFHVDDALKVFDEMPHRNTASLNAMISGFLLNGFRGEALRMVELVNRGSLKPNSITIVNLLSACASVAHGMQVHCWAINLGFQMDVYVATALLTMYCTCEKMGFAAKVFQEMSNKNVVSFNAYISGLLLNGMPRMVIDVFKSMMERPPGKSNSVTLVSVLSACSSLSHLGFGRQVHALTVKIDNDDVMVGTALVDMYSKCGAWQCAHNVLNERKGTSNLFTWNSLIAGMMLNEQSEIAVELFESLESHKLQPDSATWNSMISGHAHLGQPAKAFKYFHRMQSAGTVPSLKSLTSFLSICSDLSALRHGKEIHAQVTKRFIHMDVLLATALIDMYMKCGCLSSAQRLFDQFGFKPKDTIFWNAMISGYGNNGENKSAFDIFDRMLEEGVHPNAATFTSLLSICSHCGQVDKGWQFFKMMNKKYDLQPDRDHYNCMIDILGRAGQLGKARKLLEELPEPSMSSLASLLGACSLHKDSKLGEEMASRISELEPKNPLPFVILSNIYAELGRWKDVERVREMMNDKGLRKPSGLSSIE
ncbi:pentatricopeptide repeat-containing protein At2g02750 [Cucurbita maxima]|uniref:Pentatricopeptide repeat-containing protein At2g02750 n=1 Tax=Cucurbita maxima TaxID=3661 RepID=A0A6J1K9P7_CUCMA|nr:pentatricopeptide repeat-containing protein At2g02750 [Cucurbita maxima]